jgi:hypothetical protein
VLRRSRPRGWEHWDGRPKLSSRRSTRVSAPPSARRPRSFSESVRQAAGPCG